MNRIKITITLVTILLIGTPLFSQEQDNTLTPEEFAAGWELLFDGETLDGWKDNPYFGKSPFGHIDFQNHGSEVWYRNVKILRL